jgi:magnesium transporter
MAKFTKRIPKKSEQVKITVIDYDEKQFQEKEAKSIKECFPFKEQPTVTWINIDGLGQLEIIERLGECYGLHSVVIEDILNTDQRPKMEDFETHVYIVLKMLFYDEKNKVIDSEQVSILLGTNFVISLQERPGDVFDPIRDRIRNAKGRIRKLGSDYLAYSLIDAIVDSYFLILEKFGENIESVEAQLINDPTPQTLKAIHDSKREMIFLRRSVWPLRELINGLLRNETKLVKKNTQIFLRDLYDHTIQVIDTIESLRDMISGMLDIYLSSLSNRMNEVMKVLTIIATIFIPLTFISGIYGMNFKHMPELEWPGGYFAVLTGMTIIGILMLMYFKRKKWL